MFRGNDLPDLSRLMRALEIFAAIGVGASLGGALLALWWLWRQVSTH